MPNPCPICKERSRTPIKEIIESQIVRGDYLIKSIEEVYSERCSNPKCQNLLYGHSIKRN